MAEHTVFFRDRKSGEQYFVINAATPRDAAEYVADDLATEEMTTIRVWSGRYSDIPSRNPDYEIDNG